MHGTHGVWVAIQPQPLDTAAAGAVVVVSGRDKAAAVRLPARLAVSPVKPGLAKVTDRAGACVAECSGALSQLVV